MQFNYRLKRQHEKFGAYTLDVESLASLDETIDLLFFELEKQGNPDLLQELCPYFGVVWPAARALSQIVAEVPDPDIKNKRVIELGCGLALPSLLAAKRGASVVATDLHPDVETFLAKNLAHNQSPPLTYQRLNWQDVDSWPENWRNAPFDWVIGSDILYERQHPEAVAKTMASLVSSTGRIVLTDPSRPYLQKYVTEMERLGFESETSIRDNIFVLRFRPRSV